MSTFDMFNQVVFIISLQSIIIFILQKMKLMLETLSCLGKHINYLSPLPVNIHALGLSDLFLAVEHFA